MYRAFADMTWPAESQEAHDAAWRLAHGAATASDRLYAVSVMTAYWQMIRDTQSKRQMVIRELRQGPNLPRPKA